MDPSNAADLSIAEGQMHGDSVSDESIGNSTAGASGCAVGVQSRRSVLPELGTYPDSLVHLPPDTVVVEGTQKLSSFAASMPKQSGKAMLNFFSNI